MFSQLIRKTGIVLLLSAVLGSCAAPPAEINPTPAATRLFLQTQVDPSATPPALPSQTPTTEPTSTLKTSPAQAQTGDCSSIPLGGSLPIMTYSGGNQLAPVDPQNGLPVCGYLPLSFRDFFQYAFSPDLKTLAITDEGSGASADTQLHLVDLETWEAITATISIPGWANSLVFDPAGTQLAILLYPDTSQPQGDTLEVYDLKSQEVLKSQALDFSPSLARYTPGGDQLVLFGGSQSAKAETPIAHLLVLDTQDYSTTWKTQFPGIPDGMRTPQQTSSDPILEQWGPAVALSQAGRSLFILHADGASLTTVNLENHQSSTQDISRKVSWLERLLAFGAQTAYAKGVNGTTRQGVLSANGLFYVTGSTETTQVDDNGMWNFSSTPLGLKAIDVKTGDILDQLDTDATQLALSPDESRLYLQGWKDDTPWTDVVSTDGFKLIGHLDNTTLAPVKLLNSKTVLIADQKVSGGISLGIADPATLETGSTWKINSWQIRSEPVWLSP